MHNCFLSRAVLVDLSRLGRPVRVLSWTASCDDDDSSFWTMVVFSLSLSLFVFLSALCCGHTKKARVMSTFHPLFRERKRGIIIIIIIKSSLRESPSSSSHTHSRRRKRRAVVLSLRRCSLVLSTRPLFDRCGQQKSADELGDHPFALLSIQHLDSMLLLLLLHRLT